MKLKQAARIVNKSVLNSYRASLTTAGPMAPLIRLRITALEALVDLAYNHVELDRALATNPTISLAPTEPSATPKPVHNGVITGSNDK